MWYLFVIFIWSARWLHRSSRLSSDSTAVQAYTENRSRMEVIKAWWQIIVFLEKPENVALSRHKSLSNVPSKITSSRLFCCLPMLSIRIDMPRNGNNYWNIPIVERETYAWKEQFSQGRNFQGVELSGNPIFRCLCSVTNENFWWIMNKSTDSFLLVVYRFSNASLLVTFFLSPAL